MNITKEGVEIMFCDLTPDAQSVLLEALGVRFSDDMNYSVVPVAIVPYAAGVSD